MNSPRRRKFNKKNAPTTPKKATGLLGSIKSAFTSPEGSRGSFFSNPWPFSPRAKHSVSTEPLFQPSLSGCDNTEPSSRSTAEPASFQEDHNPFWTGPESVAAPGIPGGSSNTEPSPLPLPFSSAPDVAAAADDWVTDPEASEDEDPQTRSNKKAKPTAQANNSIPPSERMKTFLSHSCSAMDALLSREIGPTPEAMVCPSCRTKAAVRGLDPPVRQRAVYRCTSCVHGQLACAECMVEQHASSPLHVIQKWSDSSQFWARTSLHELGHVLCLGHLGQRCLLATRDPRPMVIVHADGVNHLRVQFCACALAKYDGSREPDTIQLIRAGFWPGSWHTPMTLYTLDILDKFSILSHQAQCNAKDFFDFLKRLTDNVASHEVPDRYREFLTASREYEFMLTAKRSGVDPVLGLRPGSLAVRCPACPHTDHNMDPEWRKRPSNMHFLDALHYSIDGNFQQNQRNKPMDAHDFPLTKGAAYFANEDDFRTYQNSVKTSKPDPPSKCSNFVAMHGGKASGVIQISCARHMFVLGGSGVDLQKGERFVNVDFAVVSCLQPYRRLRRHIRCYDIGCQYCINFGTRMALMEPLLPTIPSIQSLDFPPTTNGVGKLHAPGHTSLCSFKFSMHWLPGAAMTDGESMERIWAGLNGIAARTREMASGHRHDIINYYHNDANVRRVHQIAKELRRKYDLATVEYHKHADTVEQLESNVCSSKTLGAALLSKWKKTEIEWMAKVVDPANHKTLENIYEPATAKATRSQRLQEPIDISLASLGNLTRKGLEAVIFSGIALQERRIRLLGELGRTYHTQAEQIKLKKEVSVFLSDAETWQDEAERYLFPLYVSAGHVLANTASSLLHPDPLPAQLPNPGPPQSSPRKRKRSNPGPPQRQVRSDTWIEVDAVKFDLPSSLQHGVRTHEALQSAVAIECELRKGQANNALDELRAHLVTSYAFHLDRKKAKGYQEKKKSDWRIVRKRQAIHRAATSYRRARVALVDLAVDEACLRDEYKVLAKNDVEAFVVFITHEEHGYSKKPHSWIWGDLAFVDKTHDIDDYVTETVRAFWFRNSALLRRWTEEVFMLREEMSRTVRSFKSHEANWRTRARQEEDRVRPGYAAYYHKQSARYTRLLKGCEETFGDIIDVSSVQPADPAKEPQSA